MTTEIKNDKVPLVDGVQYYSYSQDYLKTDFATRPERRKYNERYVNHLKIYVSDGVLMDAVYNAFSSKYNVFSLDFKSKTWTKVTKYFTNAIIAKMKEAIPELKGADIKFNYKCGCSCGCSPGYQATGTAFTNSECRIQVAFGPADAALFTKFLKTMEPKIEAEIALATTKIDPEFSKAEALFKVVEAEIPWDKWKLKKTVKEIWEAVRDFAHRNDFKKFESALSDFYRIIAHVKSELHYEQYRYAESI